MKRTLIIVGVALLILILGIGAIWFASSTPGTPLDGTTNVPTRTFSPFGFITDIFSDTQEPTQLPGDTTPPEEPASRSVYDILSVQRAYQVLDVPVAGALFVSVVVGTTTEERLRYVERETGHIKDLVLDTGVTKRISNTTIPRIQEVLWGNNGMLVALRYLGDDKETIETYVATLGADEEFGSLSGIFLPQHISTITLHPSLPQTFYLLPTNPGVAGRIYNASTGITSSVFSSPISEWLASWNAGSYVFLSTKPANNTPGFGYTLNPTTGATAKVISNKGALTGLPNSAGDILVGSVQRDTMLLSVYEQTGGISEHITGGTLSEKCVWMDTERVLCGIPNTGATNLPDAWYAGSVFFSDSFWVIDTETGLSDYLFGTAEIPTAVDATHLSTTNTASLFSFINKRDSRLWVARVSESEESSLFPSF